MRDKSDSQEFPVVGIGASAGGLEALKSFFGAVNAESGIAYIVIMHLDPERESNMVPLLQKESAVPVEEASDGLIVEPGTVYVLPPGSIMQLSDGKLHLSESKREGRPLTIDVFLDSLAQDRGSLAAAVILSGTGTDGSNGIKKIKAGEGLVLVQTPESAAYGGMPESALSTGVVDLAATPGEMPGKLEQHFQSSGVEQKPEEGVAYQLSKVFAILRHRMGHDFSGHKESTLLRRLQRRMSLSEISDMQEYIKLLRESQQEAQSLFREFLIGVTHFFRDSEAFAALKENVLPDLINGLSEDEVLRAWVPGCSTGEEALSLAIIIREVMEELKRNVSLQIFATDLDEQAIETARQGVYPASIAADVSESRLHRFFHKEGNHYRVRKDIRDAIVFSVQDLLADPPFSRLHILCCRNVLIYLKPEAQKKLLPLFHYTLANGGVLVLGPSESIGGHTNLFRIVDQKNKIFRRRDVPASVRGTVQFPTAVTPLERQARRWPQESAEEKAADSIARLTENLLLDMFAPTAVLVEPDGTIVHVQGKTGKYLEAVTGPPTTNILDLARQGMRLDLASALRAARSAEEAVVRRDIWVKTNGDTERAELEVIPLRKPERLSGRLLVVFREAPETAARPEEGGTSGRVPEEDREARIAELEAELQKTRESHQATVEELESANEELKSTNEELQSANEELQSTNEEHESSKEELQSLNEELHTTNSELEHKINELQAANDDIHNLFNSTEIASIFVDNELKVRRFTEKATRIINLIEADVGRPLGHLVTNLTYDNLIEDVREVSNTLETKEREVQTQEGTWHKMRIIPYRTVDNRIDGAVLTFSNIHEQKMGQDRLEVARAEREAAWLMVRTIFDMNPQGLAVLDEAGAVVIANNALASAVGISEESLEGAPFAELSAGEGQRTLEKELEAACGTGKDFHAGPIRFSKSGGARYTVTGQVVRHTPGLPYRVLLRLKAAGDE